ncbi:MAG: glycoside hydrolase family 5 protein [Saprospiraceae bacterium]|nr:glycoside hydrolase family 5 protein [Saprospiraceae bacterium]
MRYSIYTICFLICISNTVLGTDIYKAGTSLFTGTWQGEGVLSEITTENPYEGGQHYRFVYNFTNHWSGFGLNMDNWGSTAPVDFTGFTHLRLVYRGVSAQHTFRIQLRSGADFGVLYDVGGTAQNYTVIDIPLIVLTSGTTISLADITEIDINVSSDNSSGNGTLYFDAIELVNIAPPPPSIAWPMAAAMSQGFNLNNWLEAYWLIPFNAYPEVNKYRREHIAFLASGGIKTMRMPVTFERLADTEPPYALDVGHEAFRLIDSCILWAQDYGLILSIDNHHGYELNDQNYLQETPRLCAIWRQIVQRYGHLPATSTLFEILNEPHAISKNNLHYVQHAIIDTIRLYAPDHTLVVGANSYNSGAALSASNPYDDNNIIYTFHSYEPYFFTHQGMSWTSPPFFPPMSFPQGNDMANIAALFSTVSAWSELYDVPVWLGEFGVGNSAALTSRCNYVEAIMDQVDLYDMPFAYWDVFSVTDGFGFADPNNLVPSSVIPCFEEAMHLNFSPLSILDFGSSIDCTKDQVTLTWQLEEQEALLEIQSSIDAYSWKTIQTVSTYNGRMKLDVPLEFGNSTSYYRLKVTSPNQEIYCSVIQSVTCEEKRK